MLILTQKQVREIIPLNKIGEIIKVVERAFNDYAQGKIQMPAKMYLYFKEYDGDLRIMPSYSSVLGVAGTKIVNVHPQNPKKGLPTVMAAILLNDAKNGLPIALMDGTYITGMRTGAASAIATKYLARKDAKTLGVIGAGGQAVFQIAALTKVKKFKEIAVFDTKEENIEKLARNLAKIKIKIKKAKIEEAAGKDVLVTVTPAREPVVKKAWIKPGTHINAIGADAKGKEELDPQVLKGAKIVIDNWEQASHSGEINVPLEKGIIRQGDIFGNLGDIVSGKKPGRESPEEITIFDSTGLAIQDLYSAFLVYKKARNKKLAREIDLI